MKGLWMVLGAMLLLCAAVSADPGLADPLQICAGEVNLVPRESTLVFIAPDPSPDLSLRAVVNSLGIGLLTLLCFVPAALLAEYCSGRSATGPAVDQRDRVD